MKADNILVIIQRSNGDVFLSSTLIDCLQKNFTPHSIDLLVNDDTIAVAKTIPNIGKIHTFSYQKKTTQRWRQELSIFKKIYNKYDLCINLTSSDRSVLYALLAGKVTISAIEKENRKSWWKKKLLNHFYFFDNQKHILLNNLEALNFLGIEIHPHQQAPIYSKKSILAIKNKLKKNNINHFFIFHPSAQYNYKIYAKHLRHKLLSLLVQLNVPVIITGGGSLIDEEIKQTLPAMENIFNWIGETTIEEYIALSELSECYIGMDTLNMHIAASQNKRVFAIFGPTILSMWSPWSNLTEMSANTDMPVQTYSNVTIFQASMPCVACGKAGCDDKHGKSECLENINPIFIYDQVRAWYLKN